MTTRAISTAIAITTFLVLSSGCAEQEALERPGEAHFAVGTLEEVSDFGGSNPAQLKMFMYVPAEMPSTPRPLVVALHGCSQTASAYQMAGWNQLADLWKFHVLYPQQNSAVNNELGCFNWGASWDGSPSTMVFSAPLHLEDLQRGHAENQSIIEMIDYMKANLSIDANRVFTSGVSGGGGFAAVMLATWPDVFAGGSIIAGVPYGCTILEGATTDHGKACVKSHPEGHELNRTPEGWGDLVRGAYPGYSGPYPKISIWHGTSDWMVAPGLVTELVEQWTNVHGIDMDGDAREQVGPAEHVEYQNGAGDTLVETYVIGGMGHAQPVDVAEPCGSAGMYFDDVGLCAASVSGRYFRLDKEDDPGDPDKPAVDVTAPQDGATVSGVVRIEASAAAAAGVTRVDFYVDGGFVDSATAEPYAVDWNSAQTNPGQHSIRAVAYDPNFDMGIDDDTAVFVQEGDGPDDPGADGNGKGGFQNCHVAGGPVSAGAFALMLVAAWLLGSRRRTRRGT